MNPEPSENVGPVPSPGAEAVPNSGRAQAPLDRCERDGLTIFKRYPGPDAEYYCKIQFRGRQYMRKLLVNADESFKRARQIRAEIRAGRFEVVDQVLAATKERRPSSPLSELFQRYEDNARGATTIAEKTIGQNLNAVRNIFRHVHGITDPKAPDRLTDDAIGKLPTTDFSAGLLEKYKRETLKTAGTNKLAEDRAHITINSTIRQARSLFCKKLPDKFYAGLVLPNVPELRAVRLLKETRNGFSMPAPDLLKKIAAALPALKQADPNAYLIYLLSFITGLRAGELSRARQHWIEDHVATKDGATTTTTLLRLQTEDDFRPKSKQERLVPLSDAIHAEIKELMIPVLPGSGTPDYILRGTKTERCDQSFRRFNAWLINLGWDRLKKAHEFRKMFGSHVAHQAGLLAARNMLGHAQQATTDRYYVGQVDVPTYKIPALG